MERALCGVLILCWMHNMSDFYGYYLVRYPVDRKLTNEEKANQLHQKERLDIDPFDNLSTIRMNSTCLECIDRWFLYRGTSGMLFLFFTPVPFVTLFLWNWMYPDKAWLGQGFIYYLTMGIIPWCIFTTLILLYEACHHTHYPIRLNRRNRMVYVYRMNGTVLRARWDDIFFTIARAGRAFGIQSWDIRAHILGSDGETVRATFALPADDPDIKARNISREEQEDGRLLMHTWEFFRRYMEEGPESIYPKVRWCHDITDKREKYRVGLRYVFYDTAGAGIFNIVVSPFYFLLSLGRWIVMHTSRIPKWPADVEAECAVDKDDPYIKDASSNPAKVPTASFIKVVKWRYEM